MIISTHRERERSHIIYDVNIIMYIYIYIYAHSARASSLLWVCGVGGNRPVDYGVGGSTKGANKEPKGGPIAPT